MSDAEPRESGWSTSRVAPIDARAAELNGLREPDREPTAYSAQGTDDRGRRWLYVLAVVEVCEHFAFFTMQGIIVLYMTKSLRLDEATAYSQFATFSALLFLAPVLGGYLADRVMQARTAVSLGSLILFAGYLVLAFFAPSFLYVSLSILIVGGGLFLPNILTIVGSLYAGDDGRREDGFSVLFTAVNVGALVPPMVTGWMITEYGYRVCFGVAAMVVGAGGVIFLVAAPRVGKVRNSFALPGGARRDIRHRGPILLGCGAVVIILVSTLMHFQAIAYGAVISVALILLLYILGRSSTLPPAQRSQLLVCLALVAFVMVYVILDHQAALSLTIFTEYNVHRGMGGTVIPTVTFQALNPLSVIILGPLLSRAWLRLDRRNRNPSVPVKFAVGACFMGAGFLALPVAITFFSDGAGKISYGWIVLLYFLGAFGELLLAPIGMSMIVRLSPPNMVSLMMGAWYLTFALASILAGFVSEATIVAGASNNPAVTAGAYTQVFELLGGATVLAGLLLLLFSSRLSRIIG